MSKEEYGKQLGDITEEFLNKRIGSQMIRTIKISNTRMDQITISEDLHLTKDMHHSSIMSNTTYMKY